MKAMRWMAVAGLLAVPALYAAESAGPGAGGAPGGPGGPGLGGRGGAERHRRLIERFDANGDGVLDESERAAARAAFEKMLQAFGRRRGGAVGGESVGPSAGGPGAGAGQPGQGPGHCPRLGQFLKQADANGDWQLDESERAALKQRIRERRGHGGRPGGPPPPPPPDGQPGTAPGPVPPEDPVL